jgi:initiation factor 1A
MVKNLKGGTGHKKLARKHQNVSHNNKLRLPEEEGEEFGCVTKMFGNGMCQIITNSNQKLIGHIRGSFRGRQKRHNTITSSMIVLIGLRNWETVLKNCDILYIYNDSDLEQVKNLPNINIEHLLSTRFNSSNINKQDNDFEFSISNEEDEEEMNVSKKITNEFKLENIEDVSYDDI